MHHLTDTLAAKVAIAVNLEAVAPIQIIEGEPVRLVCPFASTGLRATDLKVITLPTKVGSFSGYAGPYLAAAGLR
jgi:hypothetical protein